MSHRLTGSVRCRKGKLNMKAEDKYINKRGVKRKAEIFHDVTDEQWNDWHWQVKHRITTVDALRKLLPLTDEEERGVTEALRQFRMAITPYYLTLIDPDDPHDPVRKQAVPTVYEVTALEEDMEDPLQEDVDSPVFGLTHRYPDRVLFLVTDMCSMYCRHCTRRRLAGQNDGARTKEEIDACIEYIRSKPLVRDVLLSGGDALLMSDDRLEYILSELRSIDHVEMIRIGTRAPVVLPQRITPELCEMLRKYHPIYVNTHFNHPNEITPESRAACERLNDAGIPVGNQSVLLRGINDCVHVMRKLVNGLVWIRVRPYYLLPMRSVARDRPFQNLCLKGNRDYRRSSRPHIGAVRADICRRRAGRRRQDSRDARLCYLSRSQASDSPQLRGVDLRVYATR